MQATREQDAAIHIHDKNLIVVAGAGSGKTRVLVERFLQLLADKPSWRISALVAITFTKAAALEMRQRLRIELERRAEAPDGARWARHLAQLDSARINTIHGLCADLLRANSAQAGIDPRFAVLDETAAAVLLDEAVADTLETITAPQNELFAHYDGFIIEDVLKDKALLSSDLPDTVPSADELLATWQSQWQAHCRSRWQRLLDSAAAAALAALDPLPSGDTLAALVQDYREQLAALSQLGDAFALRARLAVWMTQNAVGNKGSVKSWGSREAKQAAAQTLRTLREQLKACLGSMGEPPGEQDRLSAQMLPLWHGLLLEVRAKYRQHKQVSAQLDFDDLEQLAAQLLEEPAVRARYRNAEFKHVLVDEFQDTNARQWQIIQGLADIERGGTVFAVGDPKQSIYQFRGADVGVFNRVRESFSQRASGQELALSTSFRSHAAIVAQFNALFAQVLQPDDGGAAQDYEVIFDKPMRAFRQEAPASPAMELLLLLNEPQEDPAHAGTKRRSAADMRQWEAAEIAERIQAFVAEQQPIFDKELQETRPIAYQDIAILFQSMSHVTLYEDALKAAAIPYVTIAGRGYYNRQEVWDILDLLRFLNNPADDLALATILRSPLFAFSDDLLFALRLLRTEGDAPMPLWRALQSAAAQAPQGALQPEDMPLLTFAHDTLAELCLLTGRVRIAELLREALARTQYLAILTGLPDGARRRGNVEKLLQLADSSDIVTIGKFARYLSDLSVREVRESEAALDAGEAVQLMTVHASKGLEFPLVILADATWERGAGFSATVLNDRAQGLSCQVYDIASGQNYSGFAQRRNIELQAQREQAERKRLLYVAATRAQDFLLISASCNIKKSGEWSPRGWLRQILPALEIDPSQRALLQRIQFAGQPMTLRLPTEPPLPARAGDTSTQNMWTIADGALEPAQAPPLLATLPAPVVPAQISQLTSAQIEHLAISRYARSDEQKQAWRRFRASCGLVELELLTERELSLERKGITQTAIGNLLLEQLRASQFLLERPLNEQLMRAGAWRLGLRDDADLAAIEQKLGERMARLARSEFIRNLRAAHAQGCPLHSALPYIYRHSQYTISGEIDLLMQAEDGRWRLVGLYAGELRTLKPEQHAQRFRLRMGIERAACRSLLLLDSLPTPSMFYLLERREVTLAPQECAAELERLPQSIAQALAAS